MTTASQVCTQDQMRDAQSVNVLSTMYPLVYFITEKEIYAKAFLFSVLDHAG